MKKSKITLSQVIGAVLGMGVGFICGFGLLSAVDKIIELDGKPMAIIMLFVYIICVLVFFVLVTAIHEAGHMVMGLATGYQFISYRVLSLTLVKEDDRLKFKKYSIPGTIGQCLMTYPETDKPEDAPFFLYHLGGGLFNMICFCVGMLCFAVIGNFYVKSIVFIFSILSAFMGLSNLIPAIQGGVPNDGYNIYLLHKSSEDRKLIINNLIINGCLTRGKRLSECSDRLFEGADPSGGIFKSAVSLTVGLRAEYNREFEAAAEVFEKVIENPNQVDIYKNEAKCELLFCKVMLDAPAEEIDKIYDDKLKKYTELTGKYYVSRNRLSYAYFLIYKKDKQAADKEFEKAVAKKSTYPTKGEYIEELELMEYIKEKYYN